MNSFIWVLLNIIGFVILVFIYSYRDERYNQRSVSQKLFGYLKASLMLYLIFDSAMFMLEGTNFDGARMLNYAASMLYYIVSPLPGLLYLVFCDYKIFGDAKKLRKRTAFYSIPAVINMLFVLTTPYTHLLFYIDEFNIYTRGSFFAVTLTLTFVYIFSIFPVLAVQSKKKYGSYFKGDNNYLYLFPIPPFIMAIIQVLNYGVLLIGFGAVFSVFLLYINGMQTTESKSSLITRFGKMQVIQFAVISSVMMAGMFIVIENIIDDISRNYAAYNSATTANVMEIYLGKEIGVLGAAANSGTLIEWVSDEDNEEKKKSVHYEMMKTLDLLHNDNVYIVGASGREYTLDGNTSIDEFVSHASISETDPKDKWVFDLMAQDMEYNLNIDIDKELHRKRVWLNFKISDTGGSVGIICTGMELSDIAEQTLHMQSDSARTRTIIIDSEGYICMDSAYIGEDDFLLYGVTRRIEEEIHNIELLELLNDHLAGIDGYFQDLYTQPVVTRIESGKYRYATITPISMTDWSVVTLYDSSSLFGILRLLPLFGIIALMLIVFAYSTKRLTVRMLFKPLEQLVGSLKQIRNHNAHVLYGLERKDEIGLLSNAIQDYFVEGHFDMLTGIYNRRYMEKTMSSIINTMRRAGGGKLSVLMIDIDYFKQYNDTYGHLEGDKCLCAVAGAIRRAITRDDDFAARYGGEEFTAVLPNTDSEGAFLIASRIRENLDAMKIEHRKSVIKPIVTVSVGGFTGDVALINDFKEFIRCADEALYASKENGRNRYTAY